MVAQLLLTFALAQSPVGGQQRQTQSAPSDDPTATADTTTQKPVDKPAVLKGIDLAFTVYNSSGTFFGQGGYSNSFTFWFEPSWAFGKAFFSGSWFENLALFARVPVEVQVVGNDPRFNGTGFGSAALYNPEALPIIESQYGAASGPSSRGAIVGDLFFAVNHARLFTIPAVGIDVSGGIRTTLPTSVGSRNAGLISMVAPGLIFERRLFERLSLGYAFRPTKYFYSRTQGGIAPLGTTVTINGNPETTWTPSSTGVANPDYSIINGFWATFELPKGFSLSAFYFLFNTKPYPVTGGCTPIALQDVNTCRDGAALGPTTQNPWRHEQWFMASVDFHHSFWGLSLGASTFRPLENVDGSTSQPFFESNRNNYTTVYLSFSANAEGIAEFATEKKP